MSSGASAAPAPTSQGPASPPASGAPPQSSPPPVVNSSSRVVASSPPPVVSSSAPPVVSSTPVPVSPTIVTTPTTQPPVVSTAPGTTVTPPPTTAPTPTVQPTTNPNPTPSSQPPQSPTPQQSQSQPQPTTAQPRSTVTTPDVVTITANQVPQSSGAPPITSTLTSVFSSELVSTEADGAVITTTVRSTIVIVPTGATSSSSSNTGAIVGGVAGGVAILAAVIIIFLFYWRRNRRREEFDGNFDPDRVVRHAGHTDLAGAEVTPYSYEPASTALSGAASPTFSGDSSMRQYRDSQAPLVGGATVTSGSHYAPTSSDGVSPPPGSSSHGRSISHGSGALGPGFPVAQPYRPLSSKEQEALRQRGEGGLGLASALEEGDSEVIQHSDGGRITEPESLPPSRPPQEIPPSYYSISGNP